MITQNRRPAADITPNNYTSICVRKFHGGKCPSDAQSDCSTLVKFIKTHGDDMALLREHLTVSDHDAACTIAHNLKGISGLIGTQRIASLASEIERNLRTGAGESAIKTLASECECELAGLSEAIRMLPGLEIHTIATIPAAMP